MRKFNGVPRAHFGLFQRNASGDLTTVTRRSIISIEAMG
jgi:transposase-like protein